MLVNMRTSQERFQASQHMTTFSPSSKLRLACEQALFTSPSIRAFLRKGSSIPKDAWTLMLNMRVRKTRGIQEKNIKGYGTLRFKQNATGTLSHTLRGRRRWFRPLENVLALGKPFFSQRRGRVQKSAGKSTKRADVRRKKTRLDWGSWLAKIYLLRGGKELRKSYCGWGSFSSNTVPSFKFPSPSTSGICTPKRRRSIGEFIKFQRRQFYNWKKARWIMRRLKTRIWLKRLITKEQFGVSSEANSWH